MARSGASDHVAIKRSKREVTWQPAERLIMRRIMTVDGHLRRGRGGGGGGYVAHLDSSANHFLSDLISAVDRRSYNG